MQHFLGGKKTILYCLVVIYTVLSTFFYFLLALGGVVDEVVVPFHDEGHEHPDTQRNHPKHQQEAEGLQKDVKSMVKSYNGSLVMAYCCSLSP